MVHSALQVENTGRGIVCNRPYKNCADSTFPALRRQAIGSRPSGSSLRSLAEQADYVILIQENM